MDNLVHFLSISNLHHIAMIQTVIALFIVALALAWTLMRIIKGTKNPSCNCGCDHCPSSKKTTCPHPKAK